MTRLRLLSLLAAAVATFLVIAAPAASGKPKPPEPAGFDTANFDRCDALDPAVCMQPFPNNHFTRADASTETGRRINFQRESMPKNKAGKPIEPSDYNHAAGFPPGTSLFTRVPGLDNLEACGRPGAVPVDDRARSLRPGAPVQVLDAETGQPHLVGSEIDSNPPTDAERNLIIRPAKHFVE